MSHNYFYYQPSPVYSVIDWCWTFISLLTGIIFWLEVTHFQWITLTFFIAFFVIAGAEVLDRRLLVSPSELIIKDMFGRTWRRFDLKTDRNRVSFTKHSIIIKHRSRTYQFSLFHRDVIEIQDVIKAASK